MGLLRRLQQILLRSSLLTIYESFIRSWLDMSISFVTKLIIPLFMINLNLFSMMQGLQ